MKQKPTNSCSCTVVKVPSLHGYEILHALLRAPKGPQHILIVDGTFELTRKNRDDRRRYLVTKVKSMGLPYQLKFYSRGHVMICFWEFTDFSRMADKDFFDRNAELGIYPDVKPNYNPSR